MRENKSDLDAIVEENSVTELSASNKLENTNGFGDQVIGDDFGIGQDLERE